MNKPKRVNDNLSQQYADWFLRRYEDVAEEAKEIAVVPDKVQMLQDLFSLTPSGAATNVGLSLGRGKGIESIAEAMPFLDLLGRPSYAFGRMAGEISEASEAVEGRPDMTQQEYFARTAVKALPGILGGVASELAAPPMGMKSSLKDAGFESVGGETAEKRDVFERAIPDNPLLQIGAALAVSFINPVSLPGAITAGRKILTGTPKVAKVLTDPDTGRRFLNFFKRAGKTDGDVATAVVEGRIDDLVDEVGDTSGELIWITEQIENIKKSFRGGEEGAIRIPRRRSSKLMKDVELVEENKHLFQQEMHDDYIEAIEDLDVQYKPDVASKQLSLKLGLSRVEDVSPSGAAVRVTELNNGHKLNVYYGPGDPPMGTVTPEFAREVEGYKDLGRAIISEDFRSIEVPRAARRMTRKEHSAFRRAMYVVEDAEDAMGDELQALEEELSGLMKKAGVKAGSKEMENIFEYIEEGGQFDLFKKPAKKLTAREKEVERFLRASYSDMLNRQNEVLVRLGKEPIKERRNYISHIWEMSLLDQLFGPKIPKEIEADEIFRATNQLETPFLWFSLKRKGAEGFIKDPVKAWRAYLTKALPTIHVVEPAARMKAYVEALPQANNRNYWMRWLNQGVLGRTSDITKDLLDISAGTKLAKGKRATFVGLKKLTDPIAQGLILGRLSTAFLQLSSPFLAASEAGFLRTMRGMIGTGKPFRNATDAADKITSLRGATLGYSPPGWAFALKNSRVLKQRMRDPIENLFPSTFEVGQTGVRKLMGTVVGTFDKAAVSMAYNTGYLRAVEQLGMEGADALRYADDFAMRFQNSFNRIYKAPILTNAALRPFTVFQSFPNTIFNHMRYDIALAPVPKLERAKMAARFAGSILAMNAFYEYVGLPTPFDDILSLVPFNFLIRGVLAGGQFERDANKLIAEPAAAAFNALAEQMELPEAVGGLSLRMKGEMFGEEHTTARTGTIAPLAVLSKITTSGAKLTSEQVQRGLRSLFEAYDVPIEIKELTDEQREKALRQFFRNIAIVTLPGGNQLGVTAEGIIDIGDGETRIGNKMIPVEDFLTKVQLLTVGKGAIRVPEGKGKAVTNPFAPRKRINNPFAPRRGKRRVDIFK